MDLTSKSDPFVLVWVEGNTSTNKKKKIRRVGNTEHIKNDNNPYFMKTITVKYLRGVDRYLCFEVYDKDSSSNKLNQHDYIGDAWMRLTDIIGGGGYTTQLKHRLGGGTLTNDSGRTSTITVSPEPHKNNDSIITFQFRGIKLKKKDLFSSDPYFMLQRKPNNSSKWMTTYRSEVIKKNLNPYWKELKANSIDLCENDYTDTLKFICYDYDRVGKDDLIGEFTFRISELKQSEKHALMKANKKGKPQGHIEVTLFRKQKVYHMEDYLKAGLNYTTAIAIDFSADNKPVRDPNSHHYLGSVNDYEFAIKSCADALQKLDYDSMFPVWGFSARLNGVLSHCFSLTFNPNIPKVRGIQEVINCYRNAVNSVTLGSPKVICEVLSTFKTLVQNKLSQGVNEYFVLFMFVSGGDHGNKMKVKEEVIGLSELPVSVIIVGIGMGNFKDLNALDDDWRRFVSSSGVKCRRDCVTVIIPRDVYGKSCSRNQIEQFMTDHIIETIFEQSLSFFRMKKMIPGDFSSNDGFGYNSGNQMAQGMKLGMMNPMAGQQMGGNMQMTGQQTMMMPNTQQQMMPNTQQQSNQGQMGMNRMMSSGQMGSNQMNPNPMMGSNQSQMGANPMMGSNQSQMGGNPMMGGNQSQMGNNQMASNSMMGGNQSQMGGNPMMGSNQQQMGSNQMQGQNMMGSNQMQGQNMVQGQQQMGNQTGGNTRLPGSNPNANL